MCAWLYQPLLPSAAALAGGGGGGFLSAWAVNSNSIVGEKMKKNVAGQKIGIQMVSATDGSAFTGTVTVSVTGDAGTQATGSVGSGVCAHEGNGFHTYAPAQAETNYDHIGFTFTGTGAVPSTVQLFTSFPQTGDSFALIGSTGSGLTSLATQASVNTIDDFLDTEVAAILAAVDTEIATIITNLATVDTVVDAIKVTTDKLDDTLEDDAGTYRFTTNALEQAPSGGGGGGATAQQVWEYDVSAIATANLAATVLKARASQTSVDDLPTNAELATALGTADDAVLAQVALVKAKTDNLPSDPADASVVAGLIAAVEAKVDIVDTNVDAILVDTGTSGVVVAGTINANVLTAVGVIEASAVTGTLTTTTMTTDLTEATDDHYNGRSVVFTSGALTGQATDITDYTGSTKLITMTALTEAPSNGTTFKIV